MSHTVLLWDCMELMRKLVRESRARHGVDSNIVITPYLEQDYGIKLVYDPNSLMRERDEPSKSYVIFASEADYTFLSLKYL
jgi:hypothetical protein